MINLRECRETKICAETVKRVNAMIDTRMQMCEHAAWNIKSESCRLIRRLETHVK